MAIYKIYKPFLITFWTIVLTGTLLVFTFVELVDPKGENNFSYGLEYNYSSSILNARKLMQVLSKRPSAVIFGTSRSTYLSPDILGVDVLNMHVIYANPHAVLNFLSRLDDNQLSNITQIFYLLDYHVFNNKKFYDPVDYEDDWQRFFYKVKSLGFSSVKASWQKIVNNLTNANVSYVNPDGYVVVNGEKTFDGKIRGESWTQDFREVTVSLLAKVEAFAKNRGIKTTYFMAPFPLATLSRLDIVKHESFARAVLKYIDGYYDWTYIASASPFNEQFSDASHPKFNLLKRVFSELRTDEYYVDDSNVHEFMERLKPYFDKIELK